MHFFSSGVISQSERQQIRDDISPLGQIKRILIKVERCEGGPIKLVEALEESDSEANVIIAQALRQSIQDLNQQSPLI